MKPQLLGRKYFSALELVADLFQHEKRKLSGVPYIVHLVGVSYILQQISDDEDVLIAGLLHDVLEDISPDKYSESDMRRDFGDRIVEMVKTVSHDERKHGKDQARQIYLDQIKTGPIEACLVSAADLLYNASDIVYLYEKTPDAVKDKFGGTRAERRSWFWAERFSILTSRLGENNRLIQELKPVLHSLEEIHTKIR